MTKKNEPVSPPVSDDSDLFVPPDFSDLGDWEPKRLSLMGTIHLTRWVARVGKAGFNIFEEYAATRDVSATFLSMLDRLEKDTTSRELEDIISDLFSIILPGKTKVWVTENWSNYEALEALTAWWILERAGEVYASGRALVGVLLPKTRVMTNAPANVPSDD